MSFEGDEELLKKWPEFCSFAQEALKSKGQGSSSAENASLFLNLMKSQKMDIYEEHGFGAKLAEKLDELIKKTEQMCLLNVVELYESFKQQMMIKHMTSCTVNLKSIDDYMTTPIKTGKGGKKVCKKRKSSAVKSSPPSDNEAEEEILNSEDQELGRGKRKKIRKLKFEFSEESPFSYKATESQQNKPDSSKKICNGKSSKIESPIKASKSIRTETQQNKSDSSKKISNGKPSKIKNPIKASKSIRTNSDRAVTNSKMKSGGGLNAKNLVQKKTSSNPKKSSKLKGTSKSKEPPKGPVKSNGDSSVTEAVVERGSKGVDLDMSVEEEAEHSSVLDKVSGIKSERDLPHEVAENGGVNDLSKPKEENLDEKAKDGEEPCCTHDSAIPHGALKVEDSGETITGKNVKHPCVTGSDGKIEDEKKQHVGENGTEDESKGSTSAEKDHVQSMSTHDDHPTKETDTVATGNGEVGDGSLMNTSTDVNKSKPVKKKTKKVVEGKESEKKVRSRKGRGPQKTPKKFPWSLVPIVCAMCKTRYSTYSTLRRHWTKCHSEDKKFDRLNPPKLMLCTVCDETFSWPREFLKHYREHAANEEISVEKVRPVKFVGERTDFPCDKMVPITCSVCKKQINGEGVIYSHWKKEHKTEPNEKPPPLFHCDQCGQDFDAPRKFRLHYRIHTGAKPHECETCCKTFRTFSDLTSHMLCHNESKEHKCEICGKAFVSQKILNRHMKGHLFPHVCEVCGKSYPSKYSLSLHVKIHTGEKPHKCEFCGVAFIQAGSLKLHRRLHLGDKPHVCETCGMRFNSMSHLRTHKRVHTGEKPYKCDKCPYAAASSSRLKDHATVHKDEKPHVCKVPGCGRRYKRLSHLIFHHSKHAGIKPYVCKTCGAAFKLSSELSLHRRQDACALYIKEGGQEVVQPEWSEDPPKETITDYNLLVAKPEDTLDNGVELKEETQTVYIYHNVEGQEGFQEVGDDGQQIIGLDGASHTEIKFEGQLEGQEEYEQQIVIQIVREPGQEDEDIVLSKEELERIVRLSQQM
ncbi:zinc finger protein 16 [Elysia marginata]|uniref:Zinc finger protein 16 n=1 Tax=Elysia marginata TaxID=1093978 RepID=A0AAV4IBW3_9GAST|nr:zinc finger protein 16 [Elysia marginata]